MREIAPVEMHFCLKLLFFLCFAFLGWREIRDHLQIYCGKVNIASKCLPQREYYSVTTGISHYFTSYQVLCIMSYIHINHVS